MKLPFPSPDGRKIALYCFGKQSEIQRYKWLEPLYIFDMESESTTLIADDLVSGGTLRHEPAWSSDSANLAYIHNQRLNIVNVSTLEVTEVEVKGEKLDDRFLLWSPKGNQLMAKNKAKVGSLILVNDMETIKIEIPPGKKLRGIMRRSDDYWYWSPDGQSCVLWVCDNETGDHGFLKLNLESRCFFELNHEPAAYYAAPFASIAGQMSDISADGTKVIYGKEGINSPLELWCTNKRFDSFKQVTTINKNIKTLRTHSCRLIKWFDLKENLRGGVLLLPEKREAQGYPLVVVIYPGISTTAAVHSWDYETLSAVLPPQVLLDNDLAVFIPEIFPNKKSLAKDITQELLFAVRAVMEHAPINKSKMAILGQSMGGYAVNTVVTNTAVFKSAISVSGFGNLSSHYGMFYEHDGEIDGYGCQGLETGQIGIGAPWECPLDYVNNSPLYFLDCVQTPLLLLGGSEDPIYQPEEMLVGLERLGKKVECYRYKGEGHVPAEWSLENRKDAADRIVRWIKKHFEHM